MDIIKRELDSYVIPVDFNSEIIGNFIKRVEVKHNGILITPEFITNVIIESDTCVIFTVSKTVDGNTDVITLDVYTTPTTKYSKTISIKTDNIFGVPNKYKDLEYQIITDDNDILILPNLTSGHFKINSIYTVTGMFDVTSIDNEKDLTLKTNSISFTTQYCPLFSSITEIKIIGGPDIDKFSDDTILKFIHKNSLEAIDIFNTNTGNNIPYDYFGCDFTNVPYLLRRYVECKTAYDLKSIIDKISGSNLSQLKSLGDMTIKYGSTGASPADDGSSKKDLYDCYNELMNKLGKGLDVAVKGWNDTSHGYVHPIKEPQYNRVSRTPEYTKQGPWSRRQVL